jgi:enoyl-CoA hydratase/carnithine racemase
MSIEVRLDKRGVATVTIANAAKLNTLNTRLMTDLVDTVHALAGNDALRALVLRGEGERAFIGGADITEMATFDRTRARDFITLVHRTCDCFRRLPVPAIARIAGHVLGAGVEVAASCDMRVASTTAKFGMPEVRIGIPSVVEAALLPRLIGWGRTRQLLLTGDTIDAAAALSWGLIEEMVAPDALDAAVERMLSGILSSGPHAIRLQKALIHDWEDLTVDVAVQNGIDCFAGAWQTDEPARMMKAFLDVQKARKAGS